MNIHALQLDPAWENKEASFAKVTRLLEESPPRPGSLIVLPEMFATGFSCNLKVTQEAEGGETERFLKATAERHQCAVLGGLIVSDAAGKIHNQALAVCPEGTTLARYSKIRPFSLGGESAVHQPGEKISTFTWQGMRIAPLVCYDLRFPELAREALRQGADMLVYIAAWPARRIQHWLTLLQARAIENQAYVLGVNRCGQEPEFNYCGRSALADPHGVLVADASDGEKVLQANADPDLVHNWRQDFPAARDFGAA